MQCSAFASIQLSPRGLAEMAEFSWAPLQSMPSGKTICSYICLHCWSWLKASAGLQGSGKTLAFGLPILQVVLQQQADHPAVAATPAGVVGAAAASTGARHASGPLQALILAPTRELALQVNLSGPEKGAFVTLEPPSLTP